MKRILLLIILLFFILVGCSNDTISPESAKELLENNDDVVLVDVRQKNEYVNEHIPGAILVPLDELETLASTKLADKDKTYIVYCRSGNRSSTATKILQDMGYKKVYDLGGIIDWPYDTTSG